MGIGVSEVANRTERGRGRGAPRDPPCVDPREHVGRVCRSERRCELQVDGEPGLPYRRAPSSEVVLHARRQVSLGGRRDDAVYGGSPLGAMSAPAPSRRAKKFVAAFQAKWHLFTYLECILYSRSRVERPTARKLSLSTFLCAQGPPARSAARPLALALPPDVQ